jgi:hypothetical protein
MATLLLRRFSCPETLRHIQPRHLVAFLEPYAEFLASRGIELPEADTNVEIDVEALAKTFVTPDSDTPIELIDALYFVNEMSTLEAMDELLEEAERQGIELAKGAEHTLEDVAVQMWLARRDVLERKHAERHIERARSFEYFQVDDSKRRKLRRPNKSRLARIASDLDDWFDRKRRGRGSRVLMGEKDDGIWFLVRHPEAYRREEALQGSESVSIAFRPIKYDVVVFRPLIRELRINARSVGEKLLYRRVFGRHLFDDDKVFAGTAKYTLEPLRELGADSLAHFDVEGIEWVKLREVQFFREGAPWEIVTRKSDDFFRLLELRKKRFPEAGRMIRASFQVKFRGSKRPRTVVIKPSNIAHFTRDDDSILVEKWLDGRGFILRPGTESLEHTDEPLAGS